MQLNTICNSETSSWD